MHGAIGGGHNQSRQIGDSDKADRTKDVVAKMAMTSTASGHRRQGRRKRAPQMACGALIRVPGYRSTRTRWLPLLRAPDTETRRERMIIGFRFGRHARSPGIVRLFVLAPGLLPAAFLGFFGLLTLFSALVIDD